MWLYILKLGSLNDELNKLEAKPDANKGDIKGDWRKKDGKDEKKDNQKILDDLKNKVEIAQVVETAKPKDEIAKKND